MLRARWWTGSSKSPKNAEFSPTTSGKGGDNHYNYQPSSCSGDSAGEKGEALL